MKKLSLKKTQENLRAGDICDIKYELVGNDRKHNLFDVEFIGYSYCGWSNSNPRAPKEENSCDYCKGHMHFKTSDGKTIESCFGYHGGQTPIVIKKTLFDIPDELFEI